MYDIVLFMIIYVIYICHAVSYLDKMDTYILRDSVVSENWLRSRNLDSQQGPELWDRVVSRQGRQRPARL